MRGWFGVNRCSQPDRIPKKQTAMGWYRGMPLKSESGDSHLVPDLVMGNKMWTY